MKLEQGLQALGQRILVKAGFKIGGEALAKHLGVPDAQLTQWIAGAAVPPVEVVLKAVDLLDPSDDPLVKQVPEARAAAAPK